MLSDKTKKDLEEIKELLGQVDTKGIEPMISPFHQNSIMREDIVEEGRMDMELVMADAPELKDGMFQVPKTV